MLLGASPARAQLTQQMPIDPQGCYRLTLGTWLHDFPSGWPAIHLPPEVVRFGTLADTSRFGARGYRQLRPNIHAIESLRRYRTPVWTQLAPDSLRLAWSTGFSGVVLELGARGDSLVGTAIATYDVVGPPVPKAPVVGRRTECPPLLAHSPR